jgi:glycosyltransferase involved in cell wall biosynthesis
MKLTKIKVLELIDGGFLGGGQTNVLSIISNLDTEKFEVSVAAMGGGKFEEAVTKLGVKFYPVELPKLLRSRYLRKLEKLLDIKKFDIVHSHGGVAGFYGRLLKKHHSQIKSIHTIHGIHYINKESFWVRNISKTIEQYLVQFTDITICVTLNDLKVAVENRIAEKSNTVVIHNGIDISKFGRQPKNERLMNEFSLSPENFIVGNISRFDIQKNQKLIIQASYYLSKRFPEMKFVLVGDGQYLKQMKEYAAESNLEDVVIFTGERNDTKDFYSLFNIFVLPSYWEGLPYVLLEAMASQLPVICSKIPNHLEVVKNNYSALTINPHEMDDLFQRILVLYQNPEMRASLGENAYNEVKKFNEKEMVNKISRIYDGVLQK